MVSIDSAQARRLAFSVVLGQAVVTLVVALLSYAIAGRLAAFSAVVGGGISTLASFAMTALGFRKSSGANALLAVRGFYLGEAVKLALTVVLFVVVLRTLKVSPLAMFAAYMATFFVYWVALANALPPLGGSPPKSGPPARRDGPAGP
ncbi:MAG: ATP synthase subunit I [Gammaproteobacteria bacterium]